MTSYVIEHPEKGRIEYTDRKRWLWPLSVVLSALPIAMIYAYTQNQNVAWLLFPLAFAYLVTPLADHFFGTDQTNPPEEIVPLLNQDRFYQRLIYFNIPIHFLSVVLGAWLIANYELPWYAYIALAFMVGTYNGQSINSAHEIGHKNSKFERLMSRIALAVSGYGHFCIEHNHGHHRDVATPEDVASSRMGETIYAFARREIPGALKRGWVEEEKRLHRKGKPFWSMDNHILQSYAMTIAYQGALVLLFGLPVLLFLLIHNAVAWLQLTSANYIEHYGLLREKRASGKYELCQPHHSWNANHIFSNILLYQLERHSDHHANASRPYQSLRSFENLPELPSGYFFMYALAYVPPVWFRVMDKRLMKVPHINGDLSKVNIDPASESKLRAKWATA